MGYSRVTTGLVASLSTVALLAGCVAGTSGGGDREQKKGPVTVEFWTINLKKNYGEYVEGLIDRFEKDHEDISVDWVDVPGPDLESKLLAALASDDVPDAVNIEDFRVDQFGDSLADLSPHFDEADTGRYIPGLLNSLRRGDQLKAIPWYNGGAPVGMYDTAALKKAGASADPLPTTWEDAFTFGRKLVKANEMCAFNAMPTIGVMMSYEVPLLSEDRKKAALNNPQAVAVLEKFRSAYADGVICKGAVSENIRNLPQNLENGLTASSVDDLPFKLLNIEKNAPAVYKRLRLTTAVTGSSGKFPIAGMQTFVVPRKSDVREQAAEFIKWITNAENQLAFCKLVPIFPSTSETLKDPFFTDIEAENPADEARKVVVSELPNVIAADLGTPEDVELDKVYLKRVRAFMTGKGSAEDTLRQVAGQWDALLAKK